MTFNINNECLLFKTVGTRAINFYLPTFPPQMSLIIYTTMYQDIYAI